MIIDNWAIAVNVKIVSKSKTLKFHVFGKLQYTFLLFALGVSIFKEGESIEILNITGLINDINKQNILSQVLKVNRK